MFPNETNAMNVHSSPPSCKLYEHYDTTQTVQNDVTEAVRYDAISGLNNDPFSPYCLIPLPSRFGLHMFDSSCFRRRNDRERERVRCVNDGYIRLKEHLPVENKDKRLSKVDTLRCAIQYIKHLQSILDQERGNNTHNAEQKNVFRFENDFDQKTSCLDQYVQQNEATKRDQDSDYDVLNYSSDFTDMSSDAENFK